MALPKKAKIASAVLLLTVAIGSVIYLNRPESTASTQSTDDAYIQADYTMVAPQISGTINQVLVKEYQHVKAGDLLATIDDRDFVIAVNAAKAQVASAQASVASLTAHLTQQETAVHQARAAVSMNDAELKLARANRQRYHNLAADGAGTKQALQQAEAQMSVLLASQEKNQAGVLSARQQIDILKADLKKADATLDLARATQAAAELKLSYTHITAPIDGTIGQRSLRVGEYVTTGKSLLAIVPLDAIYIIANFRETQLARVNSGQAVNIKVDAIPDSDLKGVVENIGPASGVSYSAIPPHNATGNFTKIVQRIPVRIHIKTDQSDVSRLRVGMSVTPQIQIND
jgi:membrane fusion protein (multidrug efflux system)